MDNSASSSLGLTKVVLYKHGIGYFERRGKVKGPSKINLVCEVNEIDDMLKSLLALTEDGSKVDAVTYDSSKTLESRLAEFGFDISTCEGLSELLSQMKGIPVTLSVSGETLSGKVLGIDETESLLREQVIREKHLTIYMDNNSFKRISLNSISAIRVDDEAMASELKQQLELLFQNAKKKDRKSLTVAISDEGEHDLLIAYSIPCPIWKTSYRLVMTESEQVLLQGMAIVDNVQEEDWINVQVVLVSASPISFIQPLYYPVQPFRPTIAAQGNASAGPVVAERAKRKQARMVTQETYAEVDAFKAAAPAAAPMAYEAMSVSYDAPSTGGGWGGVAQNMAESFSQPAAVEASEKGELFEYKVDKPVTIPRNSSALIPIVQQIVEGERISLYNESKNRKFPYAAVRFVNNTGLTLEGGPVTVMEGDLYAGEALLDTIKPSDLRFLLYAVDEALPVIIRQTLTARPFWRARAVNGAVLIDYKQMREKTYELENVSDRKKVVFIEHLIDPSWKLAEGESPQESTQNYHRFKLELDGKSSRDFSVKEETDSIEQIWLTNYRGLDTKRLTWLCAQNFIDENFVKFINRVMELRTELKLIEDSIQHENQCLAQYQNDQSRARENLKTLGANNERYRKIIDDSEDRISETNRKIQTLSLEQQQKATAYNEFVYQRLVSDLESAAKK